MERRGPHAKTLIQQLVALRRLPLTTHVQLHRHQLRWEGRLQPTLYSDTYLVRIDYSGRGRPTATVESPVLDEPDETLPHTFAEGRLCLHFPDEWNASHLIARTVVPWASEWLLHYELWRATGDWHGGGHEPRNRDG